MHSIAGFNTAQTRRARAGGSGSHQATARRQVQVGEELAGERVVVQLDIQVGRVAGRLQIHVDAQAQPQHALHARARPPTRVCGGGP